MYQPYMITKSIEANRCEPRFGLLISQERGVVTHFGVLAWFANDWHVVEYSEKRDGPLLTMTPLSAWRAIDEVKICAFPDSKRHEEDIRRRIDFALSNPLPYDLLSRNCEHLAQWLFYGKAKSTQVRTAGCLAAGAFLLMLLSSASDDNDFEDDEQM